MKKVRFHEIRISRQRRGEPREAWLLEPGDAALIGAAIVALLWLQWISSTS